MAESCGYTRYAAKDPFRKTNAPTSCGQAVGKTGRMCQANPAIHIHDCDAWVCGRHLKRAMQPECSVCLSQMVNKDQQKLPCGHTFHRKCMSTWEKSKGRLTCPLCRAPAYRPMALPIGTIVTYHHAEEDDIPEFARRMTEGMLMELSTYGYITASTVREMVHEIGPEWWVALRDAFCAPVNRDGTVQWNLLNYEHNTINLLYLLNGRFARTQLFRG